MFTPKNIVFDDEGRSKLRDGITKMSSAVKSTLGPSGQTVIIESENHTHGITVTKDGVTVAKSIHLIDAVENLAVRIMREASERTSTTWLAPISPSPSSSAPSIVSCSEAGSVSGSSAGGGPGKWPRSGSSLHGLHRELRYTMRHIAHTRLQRITQCSIRHFLGGLPHPQLMSSTSKKPALSL